MSLDERQSLILKYLINEFIKTNIPVGSEKLTQFIDLSSASIRTALHNLLEQGYITQPHISAGRVPTDLGYRFFVDFLLEELEISEADNETIQKCINIIQFKLEELLKETVSYLSCLTQCISLISIPEVQWSTISKIDITKISSRCVLLILVLSNGMVENKLIELPVQVDKIPLQRIIQRLNEKLVDRKLSSINEITLNAIFDEIKVMEENLRRSIEKFFKQLLFSVKTNIYIDGTNQIMVHPEFQESAKLQKVLDVLYTPDEIERNSIFSLPTTEVEVRIGKECDAEQLVECSVIKSSFLLGDKTRGSVCVIGPKRMDYARLVNITKVFAMTLSNSLTNIISP